MRKPSLHPAVWRAPKAPPRDGVDGAERLPAQLERWELPGRGPEDVAVDPDGRVYTGTVEGTVLRVWPDRGAVEPVAETGGRPLGVEVAPDGSLVVCDAYRGLLRVDPRTGRVETLVDAVHGRPLRFTNNAALAADGSVYFTESSGRFGYEHVRGDLLEHRGRGRLLRRHPDGSVELLLSGLHFANGVTLAEDGSFLLVAETAAYRIRRLWLSGRRGGTLETLADNLPGFPDNLSTGTGGVFWVALPAPRNQALDRLLAGPPVLRRLLWALPERVARPPGRVTFVLGLDGEGRVVRCLLSRESGYAVVTGAREHDGWLYLGSLVEPAIARVRLPPR